MALEKLPTEGRSQEIGKLAGRALGIKLPKNWIEKDLDGDTDYGIDYIIQLKNNQSSLNFTFFLQLKGTTAPKYIENRSYITQSFSVSTLNYYRNQEPAVMVAVVDIFKNEDKLWLCDVYYKWLDEDYLDSIESKRLTNNSVTVRIPTNQKITTTLDIWDYYSERIRSKNEFVKLNRNISKFSTTPSEDISNISETIISKPVLLDVVKETSDTPWINNPAGHNCGKLEKSHNLINTNNLDAAGEILRELVYNSENLTSHEQAEFFSQKASILLMDGQLEEASKLLYKAQNTSDVRKYKLDYIESLFRLDEIPSDTQLLLFQKELNNSVYRECLIKAKCLAITGKEKEAIDLIDTNHPEKTIGKLLISSITTNGEYIDSITENIKIDNLENNRDKFLFHLLSARRTYNKAVADQEIIGETIPLYGKSGYNIELLKLCLSNLKEGWKYAELLGYPIDSLLLLDGSMMVFTIFDCTEILVKHLEEMVRYRRNNTVLVRAISRIKFNQKNFPETIKLITSLGDKKQTEDIITLIFSYYYHGMSQEVIALVEQYKEKLTQSKSHNIEIVFCIAAQCAHESLEEKQTEQYLDIIRGFDNGEALIAVYDYVSNVKREPQNKDKLSQRLYERYLALKQPVMIAEQLFCYLSPNDEVSAERVCKLADCILSERQLFPDEYFHLTQALITLKKWEKVEDIATTIINKGKYPLKWIIIKAASLEHQGKVSEALDLFDTEINGDKNAIESAEHFANLSIRLGLLEKAEKKLQALLMTTTEKAKKLILFESLIFIYSSDSEYSSKLKSALIEYGKIVNQSDSRQEGQYLLFFLTLTNDDSVEIEAYIDDFRRRLGRYTENFPNSPILRQGTIQTNASGDEIIRSMNELVGITNDKLTKWQRNKNLIRNGKLPVPFCVIHQFLGDVSDLFATWVLANYMPDDKFEYKLRQSSKAPGIKIEELIEDNCPVLIDETALLVLNELNLLDILLSSLNKIHIKRSTFESFSRSSHRYMGSIYHQIPFKIISILNKNLSKITLIDTTNANIFDEYEEILNYKKFVFLCDDLNLSELLKIHSTDTVFINLFNVLDYLLERKTISEDTQFLKISEFCKLGIYQPSMDIMTLAQMMIFFINSSPNIELSKSPFSPVFNKVFDMSIAINQAIYLFQKLLKILCDKFDQKIDAKYMSELIHMLLLRHPCKKITHFYAYWFITCCSLISPKMDNQLIPKSDKHAHFWCIYQNMMESEYGRELTLTELLKNIVNEISLFPSKYLIDIHMKVKSAFIPMTDESDIFERLYTDMSINLKLNKN